MAESMGLPFPGETLLLLGGASAGAGYLEIWGVISAAAGGALVGDTLGYELGRWGGRPLLERYGHLVYLKPRHLARAEAFIARYGTKAVFFGRFIAILRTYSAFLAGVSRLPYPRFLLFNAAGGILWALTYGWLGAAFGSQWPLIQLWAGRAGLLMLGLLVLVALAVLLGRWAIRHEARLRARGAALLAYPWVTALRTRLAPQLAFLLARTGVDCGGRGGADAADWVQSPLSWGPLSERCPRRLCVRHRLAGLSHDRRGGGPAAPAALRG
jgi:membrane protein DedA with SNARE-associated domain